MMTPGQPQPEVEHDFRGDGTGSGANASRTWREASGSFGYDFETGRGTGLELRLTTLGRDRGGDFTILVNEHEIAPASRASEREERMVETRHGIPNDAITSARDGIFRIEFRAKSGSRVPAHHDVRLVRTAPGDQA